MLRHRLNTKTMQMRKALLLLQGAGLNVTENCNGITENCNTKQSLNQALNSEQAEVFGAPAGIRTRVFGSKGRNT